jgi:hypothetical protein
MAKNIADNDYYNTITTNFSFGDSDTRQESDSN